MTDVRSALRGLRTSRGTTAIALVVLTTAIAAATVTFSVVDAVTLRRLPFPEPDRLLAISRVTSLSPRLDPVAPQDFYSWQEAATAFESLAAGGPWALQLQADDGMERLSAWRTTGTLFGVLRVTPAHGRTFTAEHEQAGRDRVAVISHGLWVRRFGADPGVVGRPVTFGKETREILGVMPEGFTYPIGPPQPTDVWIPNVTRPTDRDHALGGRAYYLQVVGRLRPGATLEQARTQVETITTQIAAAYPSSFWKDVRPVVTTLHERVVGPASQWLLLVLAAVALVLLVAYVNVANLLLVRAIARGRELATRAALGASRARLARMLVLEALVLTTVAAAAGVTLSYWGLSIVTAALPEGLARASSIALDARVLAIAIAAALVTGLVFGLVPAWQAWRADLVTVMKDGTAGVVGGRGRLRWMRVLLGAEVAVVVAVLVATALFVTSFIRIVRADLGFDRDNVVGFSVQLAATEAIVSDLLERVAAVPGVRHAALVDSGLPLSGGSRRYSITVDGYGETTGGDMLEFRGVTAGYLEAVGARLLEGRSFEPSDRAGSPRVAVINEEAARRFFQGQAIGRTFEFRGRTTVVGVVASARLAGPEVDVRPELYVPLTQNDTRSSAVSGNLVVRTQGAPEAVVPAVQDAIRQVLGGTATPAPRFVSESFRQLTATRRFNAGVMAVFGAVALLIGVSGIYGVMAFTVAQQVRAIGLRRALGASAGRILRALLADAGRTLAAGIAAGLLMAWLGSGVFASVVYGVQPTEAWLYASIAALAALAGLLAAIVPGLRAARIDPLVALRGE
jgi:putative ABC transport system permease protein